MRQNEKPLKRIRLLYVEDEENLARLMRETIGKEFRSFLLAKNGREGLDRFREDRPDVVVTDITMPEMDGLELAESIRTIDPETPVIILSAYSDKEKLLGAIDVGVKKYFIKPFDPEELLEYLEKLAEELREREHYRLGGAFLYDRREGTLYRDEERIPLTRRELLLIDTLLDEPGHLLDSEAIKDLLWNGEASDDAVRVFVMRLRAKTSRDFLRRETGRGYALAVH